MEREAFLSLLKKHIPSMPDDIQSHYANMFELSAPISDVVSLDQHVQLHVLNEVVAFGSDSVKLYRISPFLRFPDGQVQALSLIHI